MPTFTNENGLVDETPCPGCGWPMCSCLCQDEDEATESSAPPGQAEFALLGAKFDIALKAIQKIACGTEDIEPPFRAMPLSNMRDTAKKAYKEINKFGT